MSDGADNAAPPEAAIPKFVPTKKWVQVFADHNGCYRIDGPQVDAHTRGLTFLSVSDALDAASEAGLSVDKPPAPSAVDAAQKATRGG